MKLLVEASQLIQQYYVTRDVECLRKAIETINSEIQIPTLQEHTIRLEHMSVSDVNKALASGNGFLRIGIQDADSSGVIVADKFVRVYPNDLEDDNTCFVFNVAHIDDNYVILVAVGGMSDVT